MKKPRGANVSQASQLALIPDTSDGTPVQLLACEGLRARGALGGALGSSQPRTGAARQAGKDQSLNPQDAHRSESLQIFCTTRDGRGLR